MQRHERPLLGLVSFQQPIKMQLRESSLPDSFWNPRMNQGFQFFPILSSSSAFHSRLSIFYAPFLAGRVWLQSLGLLTASSLTTIQSSCFAFIHEKCPSISTGAVVWCCSYKEVFSDGEFSWLADHLLNTIKKLPKQDGFFLCSKRRKKQKN